jgi:hypothetical protein
MHPSFVSRYETRGRALKIEGQSTESMSRPELLAVIGFLTEATDHELLEERLNDLQYLRTGRDPTGEAIDPPSNNGLQEG